VNEALRKVRRREHSGNTPVIPEHEGAPVVDRGTLTTVCLFAFAVTAYALGIALVYVAQLRVRRNLLIVGGRKKRHPHSRA
jgi:hypothetical protein